MKNTGSKKISERYVSALFSVAQKANSIAAIEKDLRNINTLIRENSDFQAFLTNPLLTREAQAGIAENLLKKLDMNVATIQFVTLLARHKRLDVLEQIIALFLTKAAEERGELAAELVTASPISDAEAKEVANSLSKAYNRQINLSVRVNPELLGGTIINVGSMQLDASLAGKLNRLQQVLKAA